MKKNAEYRMPNTELKQQGGFSLIEVLIAVVILSTGMVVVLQGMHTAIGALDSAVDKTRAAVLVRARFDVVSQAALTSDDLSSLSSSGEFEDHYSQYRWDTRVEAVRNKFGDGAVSEDESGKLYEVDVTVWRVGSVRQYRATTLIYLSPDAGGEWTVGSGE